MIRLLLFIYFIKAFFISSFRRILSQLCNHFPHGSHPPIQSCSTYDVNRLRQILPKLIEQLFSKKNKRILLVIDSVDRVKVSVRYSESQYFKTQVEMKITEMKLILVL